MPSEPTGTVSADGMNWIAWVTLSATWAVAPPSAGSSEAYSVAGPRLTP